jgi:hypothetical protein
MTQRREYKVYYESELSIGIAIGPEVVPAGAEVFLVREVLPSDGKGPVAIYNSNVIRKLRDENEELKSQLAELREAVWGLFDYVDMPPSDHRADDLDRAWGLFMKTYRDVQKETESEADDE